MVRDLKSYFPILTIFLLFWQIILFNISGCANQLPPGGGEEDKVPPKLISQNPKSNTLNFTGKSLTLKFDKYVDRRSLQDAYFISPPMGNDVEFNWSGKEVEITYTKSFAHVAPNKTFVITLNSSLKDIHGNTLTEPIMFAFSTGPKIDKGGIQGWVVNNESKMISIFAYRLTGVDTNYNPTKKFADYVSQTSTAGEYKLSNLSPGAYRVIAVYDDDKNFLYTADREDYGVLSSDPRINDTEVITNQNYFLKKISIKDTEKVQDVSNYFKDSLGIISTSIENNSKGVLPDQSIFFSFNKYKPSREDFVHNIIVADDKGIPVKMVFNWLNDSLVETFAANRFEFNKNYFASIKIKTAADSTYSFSLKFTIISPNSYGELKGSIINRNVNDTLASIVHFELVSKDLRPEIKYSFDVNDSFFNFKNLMEADYTLFTYIDLNGNGKYDYGSAYPFITSEPFYLFPKEISIRGGWAVEDVIINFKR